MIWRRRGISLTPSPWFSVGQRCPFLLFLLPSEVVVHDVVEPTIPRKELEYRQPRDVEPDADCPDALAEAVWNALDPDNRVSLYTAAVDLATGKIESKIINANK